MLPRRSLPNKKPLLTKQSEQLKEVGKQKASRMKKALIWESDRGAGSRQRSRRSRPGFAKFSKERSSFGELRPQMEDWSGNERWTKRITGTSRHRSKRRASTKLWIPPKCPTLAQSSDPLPQCWKLKCETRLPLDWPAAG